MNPAPRLLLSYRALGLGDLLTAVPALRALQRAYPKHLHVLAAPAWLAPLVEMTEAVHRHLAVEELAAVPLQESSVDVAVNLHGSGPASHRIVERVAETRPVAFHHPDVAWSSDSPAWDPEEHEVRRWCRLLEEHGIRADPGDLHVEVDVVGVDENLVGATVIHPGAKSEARRWPAERFAEVARHEARNERRVVVTGSAQEHGLARRVAYAAGLGDDAVLAGRMDLASLAKLVAASGRMVCGDTGVAHLATAVATPSVVLFGPTPPHRWGPPPDRRHRHRVLWAGGVGDPHADEPDPGLLRIGVDEVLWALDDLPSPTVATAGGHRATSGR